MHYLVLVLIPSSTPDPEAIALIDRWLQGHADGWKIGGRYDGVLRGVPVRSSFVNSKAPHDLLSRVIAELREPHARMDFNRCPASRVPMDLIPAAVVTPDGAWHDEWGAGVTPEFFAWRLLHHLSEQGLPVPNLDVAEDRREELERGREASRKWAKQVHTLLFQHEGVVP
jgi:hypothetical protein